MNICLVGDAADLLVVAANRIDFLGALLEAHVHALLSEGRRRKYHEES